MNKNGKKNIWKRRYINKEMLNKVSDRQTMIRGHQKKEMKQDIVYARIRF